MKNRFKLLPHGALLSAAFSTILIAAVAATLAPGSAEASGWYRENVPKGQDITMMDLRWPFWPKGTYFAFWNGRLAPQGGTFYGGLVSGAREPDHKGEHHPNLIWSFWPNDAYGGDVVRNTYVHETAYSVQYGGEGMSGGLSSSAGLEWMRPGNWYRMFMRVWQPLGEPDHGRIGWWVKDIANNTWRLLGTFAVPSQASELRGNVGFVEMLGGHDSPRVLERRLGYARVEGKWVKSNSMTVKADKVHTWHASLTENDTVARFVHSKDPGMDHNVAPGTSKTITTKQPDTPPIDKPSVKNVEAHYYGNQVSVEWVVPGDAAPQLGYDIEIFAEPNARGAILGRKRSLQPHVHSVLLDVDRQAASLKITLTDIFDQTVSAVAPIEPTTPLRAVRETDQTRPGLLYEYFEAQKGTNWNRIPDFSSLSAASSGLTRVPDLSLRGDRREQYAFDFSGYLKVPETGLYLFELISSDGSRMAIEGEIFADYDGRHGPAARRYRLSLEKGLHPFELAYFKGRALKGGKYAALKVAWSGPDFGLREFESSDFLCRTDIAVPTITLPEPKEGANLKDNRITLKPLIDAGDNNIEMIEYFRGSQRLSTSAADGGLSCILPAGKNEIWARMWCAEGGESADSNTIELVARNKTVPPWQYSTLGEEGLPLGIYCEDGKFTFTGDGFCFANQAVTGDFTLTARIDDIDRSTKSNGIHPNSWLGLMVKKELDKPYSWYRGVFHTAGKGVKVSPDTRDLAGARMSTLRINTRNSWLRLVREGNTVRSYTSADGQRWEGASERIDRRLPARLHAGMTFRTIPYKNKTLFSGTLDSIALEPGRTFSPARDGQPDKYNVKPGRVAALVQSKKKPQLLFARSYGSGLLKSVDHGESWRTVAGLPNSPAARFVRSIAASPSDPSTLLCGGGAVVDNKITSGLWRSADGGDSWTLVSRAIDFDGRGPAFLFGETIAFDPRDSNLVAAGGESSGVYLSRDAGRTWNYAGLQGERITCLAFNRQNNKIQLVAGTTPDSEFAELGMDRPASSSKSPGRIYRLRIDSDSVKEEIVCEARNLGVINFAFQNRMNLLYAATTRGLFTSWGNWSTFHHRRRAVRPDDPLMALGQSDSSVNALYAAPFSGEKPAVVYAVKGQGRIWNPVSKKTLTRGLESHQKLSQGISSLHVDENAIFLCNRFGIFKSRDNGKTYDLVHDSR